MDEAALTRSLVMPGGLWTRIRVVPQTGSTNADVATLARSGADEGLVLLAGSQLAGRGRMGRTWQAPPGTGLTMSVLLRPGAVAPARYGWLPLLAGVAVVGACAELAGVQAALKWPNDLLVRPSTWDAPDRPGGHATTGPHPAATAPGAQGWGKCGGILAEAVDQAAVVLGVGINVSQTADQLPPPADPLAYPPTSLALAGAAADREGLAIAVLHGLSAWYGRWRAADGDPARVGLDEAYRAHCATLGREVSVTLPGGGSLAGTATGVDADGHLMVATATGEHRLAAGDVHHVRDARRSNDPGAALRGARDGSTMVHRSDEVPLAPDH